MWGQCSAGFQVHCGEGHPLVADALNQDLLGLQVHVSKDEVFMLKYEICMQHTWQEGLLLLLQLARER